MYTSTAVALQRVLLQISKEDDNSLVKKAHELYFGHKVGDQDKGWNPLDSPTSDLLHILLSQSQSTYYWFSAVYAFCYSKDMKEAKNHVSNCYFFLTIGPCLQKQETN